MAIKTDMGTTLSNALAGLQAGVSQARKASDEVAKLTTGSDTVQDTVKPLLELQQSEQQVNASAQVVKADGETLGRFVDEKV